MKKLLLSFLLLLSSTLIMAQFAVTATNATICEGSCATISANPGGGMGPYTYSWSPVTMNGSPINVCPTVTTTYTVIITDMMGATGSAKATVTVNPIPAITCADAGICPGETTMLMASGATTYTWSPVTGLSSNTGSMVTAGPATTTNYKLTGYLSGCSSSIMVLVSVHPKPIASYSTSPTSSNPTVYFTDQSYGGIISAWYWDFGDINNTTSTVQNPSFTYPNTAGCYTALLVAYNQFGCFDSTESGICVTGIKERTSTNSVIKIYPNPFVDNTTFTIVSDKQNETYSFELYDVLGKQVRSIGGIAGKQFQVSRNGLPTGIYFYKLVDTGNLIGIGKIIIE